MNKGMKISEWLRLFAILFLLSGSEYARGGELVQQDNPASTKDYYKNYDSASIDTRSFSAEELERLRQDPELSYGYTRAATTLWDAFWRWVWSQLRDLFSVNAGSGDWDQLLLFVLFASALVYVIIRLLKITTFRIFYGNKAGKPLEALVEEENIHEMDFEKLLREATEEKNYRLAIRLCYLWALKMLADANHLHWEPGKTNHDYLRELRTSPLNGGFRELSYYFEYAWYGNFSVTADLFARVNGIFTEWKTRI